MTRTNNLIAPIPEFESYSHIPANPRKIDAVNFHPHVLNYPNLQEHKDFFETTEPRRGAEVCVNVCVYVCECVFYVCEYERICVCVFTCSEHGGCFHCLHKIRLDYWVTLKYHFPFS